MKKLWKENSWFLITVGSILFWVLLLVLLLGFRSEASALLR